MVSALRPILESRILLDTQNDKRKSQGVLRLVGRLDSSSRALPEHRHNHRFFFRRLCEGDGQEFHSGRAKISLAFTIHNLTAALFVPFAGRLVDRYGPRRVLLPFTGLLGLILVSSRFLSEAIGQLYLFLFRLGFGLWRRRGDVVHRRDLPLV
jgi:MFS family permease